VLGAGCDDGRSSFGRSNAGSFRPTRHFRLRRGAPTVIGSPISGVASSMPFAAASAARRSSGSCHVWKARSKVLLWTENSTLAFRSWKARMLSSGVMCTAGQLASAPYRPGFRRESASSSTGCWRSAVSADWVGWRRGSP